MRFVPDARAAASEPPFCARWSWPVARWVPITSGRLPPPCPPQWKAGSPWKEGQPRDAEIKQNFWEVFDDPVLTGLEQEATTNSPDLRAAFERVEQSRAVARITRADLFPGLSFDPNGNRTHYSAKPDRATGIARAGLYRQRFRPPSGFEL